ncbi:MAG: D-aminoacylase [Betaproteobacteria bacterium]|nr:D-aminoacylase [Betaproteobacteria bacterium]MDH5222104.1 D-aminoacylase [Betaproteobacteria bacterium]MDH5352030.1 D-aminoacylase [Betaproteobacteria bacterium]
MSGRYSLLIRNGTVIDGTRAPRFAADLAVRGGRIAAIGRLAGARADAEIDATGRIVAPGFIDAHTHDDRLLLSAPDMAPKASQGVTTVIAGNCGISLAPLPAGVKPVPPMDLLDGTGAWFRFPTFAAYVEELRAKPAATNAALLVGHSTLRVQAIDDLGRPASGAEIARMRALADEALAAGAIGVSTGLWYEPASAATTEEVVEVCRPLARRNGLYCTHMRDEGDRVLESLEETFRIGRELGVPVVVSHHKVMGRANHGRSRQTLALIEARMRAQRIGLDCYPYCASSTILTASRVEVATKVLVTWSIPHPELAGLELAEIEKRLGLPTEAAIAKLLPAGAIYFSMDEADVQRILAFEQTMVGSDGLPHDAAPHPRLWGTFPRVLGHYARRLSLFPLETAVYKMTGLAAQIFGLAGRGVLKEGNAADITIFDAGTVDEAASFAQPIQPARGIDAVVVNGEVVWRDGKATGARPGQVLARS